MSDNYTQNEIDARFQQGSVRFEQIETTLGSIDSRLGQIEIDVGSLTDVRETWEDIRRLARYADNVAKGLKWVAGIFASIGLIYEAIRYGMTGKP